MNIGILTFYKVANFGANLQGVSTYYALKKMGHEPIFIDYQSTFSFQEWTSKIREIQGSAHDSFLKEMIPNQTEICQNKEDLERIISKYAIEGIIIGSDAVVQHHPLITRIKKGRRKPFYISHPRPESMFPNLFWGDGYVNRISAAMMSVSSQNSGYQYFSSKLKKRMRNLLSQFKYISVRDNWTQSMFHDIVPEKEILITPDPVFAFNQNVGEFVPSKKEILDRFNIPENYVLVSLFAQSLSEENLLDLKYLLEKESLHCVAFPMPFGYKFNHPFDFTIPIPLSPIDWYALIKYSKGYVGSNMHPIIVALHNAVPCFSIDNWGTTDFFHRKKRDGSSKIEHILSTYDLQDNRKEIENGICEIDAHSIVERLLSFPHERVRDISAKKFVDYKQMMCNILTSLFES